MSDGAPVTIKIIRRVKPGREAAFEAALREFIPRALCHPGHLGVQVLHPLAGTSNEWVVVIKFQSRSHYDAFRTSAEYQAWTAQLLDLLEAEPVYHEQSGLESWFALPGATAQPVLPRWKMALVTWLGVDIAVIGLSLLLGPWMAGVHWIAATLFMNMLVVILLTWAIMPLLVRVFRPFLFSPASATPTEKGTP